jgi:hypothetical protein
MNVRDGRMCTTHYSPICCAYYQTTYNVQTCTKLGIFRCEIELSDDADDVMHLLSMVGVPVTNKTSYRIDSNATWTDRYRYIHRMLETCYMHTTSLPSTGPAYWLACGWLQFDVSSVAVGSNTPLR